uniref:Bloodthirsty-related gene family, member 21 n=1 Tax=Sinocyclocheilus grahami TaxID=75366 RepID=A0A672RA37_SINGR
CLDLFTDPVSTPCGHNFCKSCLNQCWNNSQTYRCPFCKAHFKKRPDLKINTALRPKASEKEKADSIKLFTDLIRSIERCQSELLEMMEQKQKAAEKQAEELIKELEQEITELKRRDTELEQLSHTEDHLRFLQIYPSLIRPPCTSSCAEISISDTQLSVEPLRKALVHLQQTLDEKLSRTVDVTLDPDTAYPNLVLSDDGKQVTSKDIKHKLPNNPERFDYCPCVLAHEGFSSGRFYFEVQVKGMTDWDLGVARESINRKGIITAIPEAGYWIVVLRNGNNYLAGESSPVPLSLRVKPQVVGVFVDYEEGLVSFYDVESRSHIFSFTSQSFTEKLFPFFSPCKNEKGKIAAPLIISRQIQ